MRVIVIGAGFAGACAALTLREQLDADVTVLEQGRAPGGMLHTLHTRDGLPFEYGPRVVSVFRGTPDILPFLRRFVALEERDVYQGTRLRPDYPVIPFPVDMQSLTRLPCGEQIRQELEEIRAAALPAPDASLRHYLEATVGPTLTELAFEGFNVKFWGRPLERMPADWGRLRRLERIADIGDFRLPSEAPHHYPPGGFDPLFERMLAGIDVRTETRAERIVQDGDRPGVITGGERLRADLVIATSRIDTLLEHRFGPLEWRGYRVEPEVVEGEAPLGRAPDGVPFAWVYTPWLETPVSRTTDFGVIHHGPDHAGQRVVLRETVDESVSMYPVWWEAERFDRYLEAASEVPRLVPLGRLGLYKYVTMDSTLSMVQRLIGSLEAFIAGDARRRLEILRHVRGDWQN